MRYNIEIQATKPIGTPNPNMWGIFYEEINHAGDGGLYAELIRNRNFAECNLPEGTSYYNGQVQTAQGHVENFDISDPLPGWRLHRGENCLAVMERTEEAPRNPAVAQQLALTVVKSGAGAVITNDGYWGIPAGKKGYHGYLPGYHASHHCHGKYDALLPGDGGRDCAPGVPLYGGCG